MMARILMIFFVKNVLSEWDLCIHHPIKCVHQIINHHLPACSQYPQQYTSNVISTEYVVNSIVPYEPNIETSRIIDTTSSEIFATTSATITPSTITPHITSSKSTTSPSIIAPHITSSKSTTSPSIITPHITSSKSTTSPSIIRNRIYNEFEDIRFRELMISDKWKDYKTQSIHHQSFIFDDTYTLPAFSDICHDGLRSIEVENAGGQSEISEMFSIDYFCNVYGASNVLLEQEISYAHKYKMADFICTIKDINNKDERVGISVSRGMAYPTPEYFTIEKARHLLYKKLYGLIVARNCVIKEQSFYKSILHIWCQSSQIVDLLKQAYEELDDNDYGLDIKGVLILRLTLCTDKQLYTNILSMS